MSARIVTNGARRNLVALVDVPSAEREQFAYIVDADTGSDTDTRLVRYRGRWYDTSDTMPASGIGIDGWDDYRADGFYSGVVFRWNADDDYETVTLGTYYAQ